MTVKRSRGIVIGGLVLAVVLFLFVVLRSDSTYEVRATFDEVRGLIEGGEVKAGAINVGTVSDISLDDNGSPVVTLRIDSDYRINQGAFADIRLVSNVGAINRFVELSQGDGPPLPDGAMLGPSHTDQPVDLDLAVSVFDPKTREDMAALIAGIDNATKGRGVDLAAALRHSAASLGETARVLRQVNSDGYALKTLVADSSDLLAALADRPDQVGQTADLLAQTLAVTARRQAELARTSSTIGPAIAGGRQVVERADASISNLRGLVADAGPAVDELGPTLRVLRPAVAALRPLLAEARGTLDDAPSELRALNGLLSEVNPLLGHLDPILRGVGPLLDQLRARAPEVVSFFTMFGDATSDFDLNGNLIRSTAIPIQTPRHPNLINGTSDAAGSLVRPFDRVAGSAENEPWKRYYKSFIGGGRRTGHFITPDEESP